MGCQASNHKETALALFYSAYRVWEMSAHVYTLGQAVLNEACRSITGCLRPISVENVYILAGSAPPGVSKATPFRHEKIKQTEDPRHSLYRNAPANTRLKSPLDKNPSVEGMSMDPPPVVCTTETESHAMKTYTQDLNPHGIVVLYQVP